MFGRLRTFLSRSRPVPVGVTDGGLIVNGRQIAWGEITRVAAFRRDIYLGKVVCLAIETKDGLNVHSTEGDEGYLAVQEGLRRGLPGMMKLEDWLFKVTSGQEEVVLIYERKL